MGCADQETAAQTRAIRLSVESDFNAVYRKEVPWLVRFFRSHTGSGQDALSLAQEVVLRFIRIQPTTEINTRHAYLRRSAANLLRDQNKASRRRAADRHVSIDDYDLAGPSLERQLEARDMLRLIEAAMLDLRPRTREVFMAVRVDGMSYAEVGEHLSISRKAIEKEMARAIAHINRATGRD